VALRAWYLFFRCYAEGEGWRLLAQQPASDPSSKSMWHFEESRVSLPNGAIFAIRWSLFWGNYRIYSKKSRSLRHSHTEQSHDPRRFLVVFRHLHDRCLLQAPPTNRADSSAHGFQDPASQGVSLEYSRCDQYVYHHRARTGGMVSRRLRSRHIPWVRKFWISFSCPLRSQLSTDFGNENEKTK